MNVIADRSLLFRGTGVLGIHLVNGINRMTDRVHALARFIEHNLQQNPPVFSSQKLEKYQSLDRELPKLLKNNYTFTGDEREQLTIYLRYQKIYIHIDLTNPLQDSLKAYKQALASDQHLLPHLYTKVQKRIQELEEY